MIEWPVIQVPAGVCQPAPQAAGCPGTCCLYTGNDGFAPAQKLFHVVGHVIKTGHCGCNDVCRQRDQPSDKTSVPGFTLEAPAVGGTEKDNCFHKRKGFDHEELIQPNLCFFRHVQGRKILSDYRLQQPVTCIDLFPLAFEKCCHTLTGGTVVVRFLRGPPEGKRTYAVSA